MTLSMIEQADIYKQIKREEPSNWKAYAPPEYQTELFPGIPLIERLATATILLVVFMAPFLLQLMADSVIMVCIWGLVIISLLLIYLPIRNTVLKREYTRRLSAIKSSAEQQASAYVSMRCADEGVSLCELQGWVKDIERQHAWTSKLIALGILD